MRRRWPRWIRGLLVLGAVFLSVSVALMLVVEEVSPTTRHYDYWRELLISTPIVGVLGATILVHRPKHPIGLVLLLSAVANSVALLAGSFSVAAAVLGWPLVEVGAWLANLLREHAFILAFGLLFLLYPSGVPLGRLGRWMAWTVAMAVTGSALVHALEPGPLTDFPALSNPLGVSSLEGGLSYLDFVANVIILGVGLVGGVVTIAIRLVRSRGIERLQIRVFLYAAIVAIVGLVAAGLVFPEAIEGPVGSVLWTVFPMMVVAAMAMAIVRYRLYDIDLVINRTLVYGSLTVLLGALYVAGVVGLPRLFPVAESNDLLVAGSTLAVAALFSPLRRRLQSFVDRRFYRSRYDAARTVEAFAARLREKVGLGELTSELVALVGKTLQPAHVSVWLAGSPPLPRPGAGAGS